MASGDHIVILDAGSQFGKVIDRKVRNLKVETMIHPLEVDAIGVLKDDPKVKGIIISGGPNSVYAADAPAYHPELFNIGKPVLGICYGMQLMCRVAGGTIESKDVREDGQDTIAVETDVPLFAGLAAKEKVLLTHGDSVTSPGEGFVVAARSSSDIIAAVYNESKRLFGVQFHPEVDLSENGVAMFRNFCAFCDLKFDFTPADREQTAIQYIQEAVGPTNKVLCLASGGVDSTVCAALLHKALGTERVVCVHINHGFMRQQESEEVTAALGKVGVKLTVVDAWEDFKNSTTTLKRKTPAEGESASYESERLEVEIHPEAKRKIIGDTFMRILDRVIPTLDVNPDQLLFAQGTLRPDLIESGSHLASKKADAIKTHHNDTELVRELRVKGKIIEPLSSYHKDEVRELGRALGLPAHLVMRQPFPGPGLAIRMLCTDAPFLDASYESTVKTVESVLDGTNAADSVQARKGEITALNLKGMVLPIRSVGVQGDGRTYAYAVAVTKKSGEVPTETEWVQLLSLVKVITQLCHTVNRVVYLFGSPDLEAPKTVTNTTCTKPAIDRLRVADNVVSELLIKHDLLVKLSQVPVVMIPIGFGVEGSHSIVLRTFITNDFMTGVPATPGTEYMPSQVLSEMVAEVSKCPGISRVLYDMTAKPPGTTEWE